MQQTAPLEKIAEGREAEMFAWENGRVLRLYRPGWGRGDAAHQALLLNIAAKAGILVPAEYGVVEVDGREGIVLERLDGPDLLTQLGSQPWRVFGAAGMCGRVHAGIHLCEAPSDLESTHDRYRRIISGSDLVPDDIKSAALKHLDSLAPGDRLTHGDFHPGNVMWKDGQPAVIDWNNATPGVPEADYFRTYMMAMLGDLPPGSPLLVRLLLRVGRRIFRDGYDRAYRRARKLDGALVDSWRLPVATGRIAEGIEVERSGLLRLIDGLAK